MSQGAFIYKLLEEYETKHDYWRIGHVTRHVDIRCMRFLGRHVYMLLSDGRDGYVGRISLQNLKPVLSRISTSYQVIRGARITFHKITTLPTDTPVYLKKYIQTVNKGQRVLEIDSVRFIRAGGLFRSIRIDPIPYLHWNRKQADLDYCTETKWAVYSGIIQKGNSETQPSSDPIDLSPSNEKPSNEKQTTINSMTDADH